MTDSEYRLKPGERLYVRTSDGGQPAVYTPKGKGYTRVTDSGVVPPPDPVPTPPTGHLFGVDLKTRPTTGAAWTSLKAWADRSDKPDLRNQDNQGDVVTLAQGLVFARTGDAAYRSKAIANLDAAKATAGPGVTSGDTLGMVRGMGAIALAATLIDYRPAPFVQWMRDMLSWENPDRDYTIRSTQEKRPNNWMGHAGASRVAMAIYLRDKAELDKAAQVFRGFLGDRSAWSEDSPGGFVYGELSWQADAIKPVGVNPKGATKDGVNIDGIIPDDMRRGGSFPTIGATGVSYTWECSQGLVLTAELLHNQGYPAWEWQDRAVARVIDRIVSLGHPAEGDDRWIPYITNLRCGRNDPKAAGVNPGKGFIGAEWIYR